MAEPGRRAVPVVALAAALAPAAALVANVLPAPIAAVAVGATLTIVPGALAARVLAPRGDRDERLMLALAITPFAVGAPGALLMLAGLAPAAAARGVAALVLAAALAALVRPAPSAPAPGRAGILAAAAWTALVAAVLFGNPWLPPRSDGWYHAAIAGQIAQRGLPPEDPFFAGLPLLYFWGYHAWAALWPALDPRLTVWAPLITLNLAAAFAVVLGVCALARRLGAGAGGQWAAAGAATLGYAPFAWGWIAVRTLTGEVRGLDELRRIVSQGVDPVLQYMSQFLLHVSMVFFGDKALVLTPFGMGLVLFVALVLALDDLTRRPGVREGARLAALAAATLWLHTVVGLCALLVLGAWWVSEAARRGRTAPALRRAWLVTPLALGAGLLAVLPYVRAVTSGKEGGQLEVAVAPYSVTTAILAGALVVPAGLAFLWRRRDAGLARVALPIAVALLTLGIALRLTENNQSKFFNLLFLLLAAPAGLAWLDLGARLRGARRAVLVAAIAAGVVPTVGLALWGFASERGQTAESWAEPSALEREACAWLRAHTPADALVADVAGSRDVMTLAARTAMWGGPVGKRDWGHPPDTLALRRRAAEALCRAAPLEPDVRAFVTGSGRAVVVLARRRDGDDPGAPWRALVGAPGYHELFANADVRVYRWEAGP